MRKLCLIISILTIALLTSSCYASGDKPEIGAVKWQRDVDAALKASKQSGKPIFLLFQEVPG